MQYTCICFPFQQRNPGSLKFSLCLNPEHPAYTFFFFFFACSPDSTLRFLAEAGSSSFSPSLNKRVNQSQQSQFFLLNTILSQNNWHNHIWDSWKKDTVALTDNILIFGMKTICVLNRNGHFLLLPQTTAGN